MTSPRAEIGTINLPSQSPNAGDATVLPLRGLCPSDSTITEFDVRNMTVYTWLLIAEEDGAGLDELAAAILKFDLSINRDWAIRVTRSYLLRARWVHDYLYPWLD